MISETWVTWSLPARPYALVMTSRFVSVEDAVHIANDRAPGCWSNANFSRRVHPGRRRRGRGRPDRLPVHWERPRARGAATVVVPSITKSAEAVA